MGQKVKAQKQNKTYQKLFNKEFLSSDYRYDSDIYKVCD